MREDVHCWDEELVHGDSPSRTLRLTSELVEGQLGPLAYVRKRRAIIGIPNLAESVIIPAAMLLRDVVRRLLRVHSVSAFV